MKRVVAAILALSILAPIRAEAFYLSCGTAFNAIAFGSDNQRGIAIGHGAGVVDMLAALSCFVRKSNCNCLETLVTANLNAYSEAVGQELTACAASSPNVSAVGPIMRAAARVCGS